MPPIASSSIGRGLLTRFWFADKEGSGRRPEGPWSSIFQHSPFGLKPRVPRARALAPPRRKPDLGDRARGEQLGVTVARGYARRSKQRMPTTPVRTEIGCAVAASTLRSAPDAADRVAPDTAGRGDPSVVVGDSAIDVAVAAVGVPEGQEAEIS